MSYRSMSAAGEALRAGEVTSVELTREALAAADAYQDVLGVFIRRFDEQALETAEKADAELASGIDRGPVHGIPLGIKDILATVEAPATAQSLVLGHGWPHQLTDAPVVARLRASGGVVVGKTTTSEFAIGFPDAGKPFPIPRNPWNPAYSPGGSSAGTGAGIPAGMFLGGLGTDTGGSVRMPAAFCGITGLKATFGRVPKSGCAPLAYTLDGVGPMAPTARDCALMLSVMAGYDASDPYCADEPVGDYLGGLTGDLSGLRIGVDFTSWLNGPVDPAFTSAFEAAVATLGDAGATVVPVELPCYEELVTAQWITMATESAAYHRPDLAVRWQDYGVGARNYFAGGALYSAMDYVQAQRVRRFGQAAVAELFASCDLVVDPACTMPAWVVADVDPVRPMGGVNGLHTQYWNAVGYPSMSVPIGFTAGGMPLAMQINGRPFDEATVLRAGDAYQRRTDWHTYRPDLEALASVDAGAVRSALPPYEPAPDPAELAVARYLLEANGIRPGERELGAIAEGTTRNRTLAAKLYSIPAARYEEPALSWSVRVR